MKVFYIDRKCTNNAISIEKLFDFIRAELKSKGLAFTVNKNPYDFSPRDMIKALLFFRRNNGEINHITGDVHWIALVLSPKNTILTIHDTASLINFRGIKRYIYFMLWYYLPLKRMKYITVISQKTREDIIALMPWSAHKVKVINNCLTISESFIQKEDFIDCPNVLIIGTRANKNVERMIISLADFKCILTIVGKLTNQQQALLEQYSIDYENYISVTDEKLLELYAKTHILAFASTFEGFGLPILEAQSQNCIVLTAGIEPMLSIGGTAAVYVDPYSIASIKDGFEKIVNNPALRQALRAKGKQNIKRFSVEKIASEYLELYTQVAEKNHLFNSPTI